MSICVNGLFSEVTIYGSSFPFFKLTSDLIGWRQDWLQRNGSKFQFINSFSPYTILYKIPYNTSVDRLEQTDERKTWFTDENCSRVTPSGSKITFIFTAVNNSEKNKNSRILPFLDQGRSSLSTVDGISLSTYWFLAEFHFQLSFNRLIFTSNAPKFTI